MRRFAAVLLLLASPVLASTAPRYQTDEVPVADLATVLSNLEEAGLEVFSVFPAQTVSRQECPPLECFDAAPGQRICVDPVEPPLCATVTETVTVKVISRTP